MLLIRVRFERAALKALPRAPARARRAGRQLRSSRAYVVVLGLWLIFYGQGVVDAVRFLAGAWSPGPALTWGIAVSRAAGDVATTAAAVSLVTLLAGRLEISHEALGWRPSLPRRYRSQAVVVAVLYTFALGLSALFGDALRGWFGGVTFPHRPSSPPGILDAVTHSLAAGIIEELVLVAALVTVLEAARQPVWRIYVLGVAVRWSFHVYYAGSWGLGMVSTLWVVGWAAAAIGLFRWTRRLTPLIMVHVIWDLVGSLAYLAGDDWAAVIAEAVMLTLVVTLLAWRGWRRRVDRRRAQARVRAVLTDVADRTGVPTPAILVVGGPRPELCRDRRGQPVLRYDAAAANRHTDDQMTGLIAHELQHLAVNDPLPRSTAYRVRDVVDRAAAAVAVLAAGIVFSSWFGFALRLWPLAVALGAMFMVLLAVRAVDEALERRRLRRTSAVRWKRKFAADRRAADVVGVAAARAAVKTPGVMPTRGDKRARPLPPINTRLAALAALEPAAAEPSGRATTEAGMYGSKQGKSTR